MPAYTEYLKYWPIVVAVVSFATGYTTLSNKVQSLQERQDRQGTALGTQQAQITSIVNDVSGLKADISSIKDNVNYIRSRIDSVTR